MFVTALQQGEELGAPIVDTLVALAKDMRRTDAQNARRKAARAVPKATMMITTFMVPATMLLRTRWQSSTYGMRGRSSRTCATTRSTPRRPATSTTARSRAAMNCMDSLAPKLPPA